MSRPMGRASSRRSIASLLAVKRGNRGRWISSTLVLVCVLICVVCLVFSIRSDSSMSAAHHFVEAGAHYNNEILRKAKGLILVNDIGLDHLEGICPTSAKDVQGAVCPDLLGL